MYARSEADSGPRQEQAGDSLVKQGVGPHEWVYVDVSEPLAARPGYTCLARIGSARGPAWILDISDTPQGIDGYRRPFGDDGGEWESRLLIIDETVSEPGDTDDESYPDEGVAEVYENTAGWIDRRWFSVFVAARDEHGACIRLCVRNGEQPIRVVSMPQNAAANNSTPLR